MYIYEIFIYLQLRTCPVGLFEASQDLSKKSVPGLVCKAPSPALEVSSPEMKHWLAE